MAAASSSVGLRKHASTTSDAINFCHQLSFGTGIERPEDLKYWAGILQKFGDDFSLLLSEMRRSRQVSAEDVFSELFSSVNVNVAARSRPAALVVSLFIQATGRFPTITDVTDTLSACSVQQLRVRDVIALVAERSGADSRTLKKAIGPYLALGLGIFGRLKLSLTDFGSRIQSSDALADLMSINNLVRSNALSHDIVQMQSTLVNISRLIPADASARQV
ncbi:hypothetical protein [Methylobacterium symbioticum]|nr:hypothetical protein [Methylobacterium symbioticum]